MSLAAEQDADLIEILAEAVDTFTFDGSDYACIASERKDTKELEEGGFLEGFDMLIVTRTALFGTLPVVGQQVTRGGVIFRIASTGLSQSGKQIQLGCETLAK